MNFIRYIILFCFVCSLYRCNKEEYPIESWLNGQWYTDNGDSICFMNNQSLKIQTQFMVNYEQRDYYIEEQFIYIKSYDSIRFGEFDFYPFEVNLKKDFFIIYNYFLQLPSYKKDKKISPTIFKRDYKNDL